MNLPAEELLPADTGARCCCILKTKRGTRMHDLLPGVAAHMKRRGARWPGTSSAPVQGDSPVAARFSWCGCRRISWAMHGPDRRPPVIFRGPSGLFHRGRWAPKSRSKRFGEPSAPAAGPEWADHATGLMIADAVRYMSVHSWTQWDSHGLSGTSPGLAQQPARPGKSSSRAISAGGGRCWVRTNVG